MQALTRPFPTFVKLDHTIPDPSTTELVQHVENEKENIPTSGTTCIVLAMTDYHHCFCVRIPGSKRKQCEKGSDEKKEVMWSVCWLQSKQLR